MSVKIKDRDINVEMFRIALNIAEISICYETADLVYTIHKAHKKKGGEMTMSDSLDLKAEHEEKWLKYHVDNKKEE